MIGGGTSNQVEALLSHGRHADAARLLLMAAAAGDPQACTMLASWRIAGTIVRRDLAAARTLLGRAAAGGDREGALVLASFRSAGVGGAEDWAGARSLLRSIAADEKRARMQLDLLEKMMLDEQGNPTAVPEGRLLSSEPKAILFERFATSAECEYLRQRLEGALTPSVVVDPATGRLVPHPIRSSDGAAFGVLDEDLVVNAVNRRIAAASGTRPAQGEPLQLLRYKPRGEYRAHMDALPGGGNQRILTVILYLSDKYRGGETKFMRTGLTVRARKGDALLFVNVKPDGTADPLSLHAGLPVLKGEKLIATRWIRAARFTYPPPPPLLNL